MPDVYEFIFLDPKVTQSSDGVTVAQIQDKVLITDAKDDNDAVCQARLFLLQVPPLVHKDKTYRRIAVDLTKMTKIPIPPHLN
jgi:hypothetical protein